jgi:Mg2+ and Co2+ transporter CorA
MTDILEISHEIDAIAIRVRDDFSQLYTRAKALLDMRIQSIQVEMSALNIRESKKGLQQAERVGSLTRLAFVFIPLTFVTSLFSMNVTTFATPNPSIGVFFAVAIPFTMICISVPLWKELKEIHNACAVWYNRIGVLIRDCSRKRARSV